MRTIYRSKTRNFSTFVMYKGRVRCISFTDQGVALGFSTYTCNDPELCKVIEALPSFGKAFQVYKKEEVNQPKKAEEIVSTTPYPKVKKIQEAIAVLESEFGVDSASIVSKSDALRYASQYNISFPNLK